MTPQERLEGEITALRTEYDILEAQLATIHEPQDQAWAKIVAALRKDKEPPAEVDRTYNKLNAASITAVTTQTVLLDRIARLSSPAELERRLQDATSTLDGSPKPERKSAGPKLTARDRGVPDVYLGESGNFQVGMDARYKSDLICAALGLPAPDAKMPFDPDDAVTRLEERGWTKFLDKKRTNLEGR